MAVLDGSAVGSLLLGCGPGRIAVGLPAPLGVLVQLTYRIFRAAAQPRAWRPNRWPWGSSVTTRSGTAAPSKNTSG